MFYCPFFMLKPPRLAVSCAATLCLVAVGFGAPAVFALQGRPRTVHATVMASDGRPLTDLTAADFEVREGGRSHLVTSATMATSPIRVAIIVADGGSGAFQAGTAYFIRDLLDHGSFALFSVLVQPERFVDYTNDALALRAGVDRLGIRTRTSQSAQLMEAIMDAAQEVKGEADRSAIIVCRVGGENPSTMRGETIRREIIRRRTVLYVVSTAYAQAAAPTQVRGTDNIAVARGQLADDDIASSQFQLQMVLGDGSKESGGRHDQVVGTRLVPAMRQIASELNHQYRIVYELPPGVKPSERVEVRVKRNGVHVQAPSRVPAE